MITYRRNVWACIVAVSCFVWGGVNSASATDSVSWEWLPYRVAVVLQTDAAPQLSPELLAEIRHRIRLRLQERMAPAWELMIAGEDAEGPETATIDKRFDVRLAFREGQYYFGLQETDTDTGSVGPLVERRIIQRESLPEALIDSITAAFRPTVLVDDLRGQSARLRFRAGRLFPGDVLRRIAEVNPTYRPFLRRVDRDGRVQRIDEVPWTYVMIEAVHDDGAPATIVSGRLSPFGGMKRGRTERVGISVGRPMGTTSLMVTGREGATLNGVRVVRDAPLDKAGVSITPDATGRFSLSAVDGRPQTYVVTSRFLPLAKVPIVPGLVPELTLPVAADSNLFAAEERLMQWQANFLDLHIRRRVLLVLAAAYLEQAKPESAGALLSMLDQGERPSEKIVELESLGRRLSADADVSRRAIDRLIGDAVTAARELDDSDFAAEVRGKLRQAAK